MAPDQHAAVHQLTVAVDHPDQLFDAADMNPLRNPTMAGSGLDTLREQVADLDGKPFSVSVSMPAAEITDDLEGRLQTAIKTYCAAKMGSNDLSMRNLKRVGRHQTRVMFPWLLGIVVLGAVAATAIKSGDLGDGVDFVLIIAWHLLFVASWIVIWMPIDYWMYEWRPVAHQNKAWAAIAQAPISVVPSTPTGG